MKTPNSQLIQRSVISLTLAALLSPFAVARAQGQERGNTKPPDLPLMSGEELKKEFNDEDLKACEERPRGKFGYGLLFDDAQSKDPSSPVVIVGMQTLSGGERFACVFKMKRLKIENRSARAVNSVQLGWVIVSPSEPEKVLSAGNIPFANIWVEANSSKVVEIPTIYTSLLFKSIAKDGEVNGKFQLTFGVREARFDDGTFWRRQ